MTERIRHKVLAYITRQREGRTELLVFDHVRFPEAGTQVPAGTVEEGEPLEEAVLREVYEESGLTGLRIARSLGCFDYFRADRQELHKRHLFILEADRPIPDRWIHVVSSGTEDSGLEFEYFWIDAATAAEKLSGKMGEYLIHAL